MNILVSPVKKEYRGFMVLKTLAEAEKVRGNIDFLIYHKSVETDDIKVSVLSKIKDRVENVVYICSSDSLNLAVKMMVTGMGGTCLDDEYFLDSSEELNKLVTSLNSVASLAVSDGEGVLLDFITRYLKEGSTSPTFSGNYLRVVRTAVQDLINGYSSKELELIQTSETASALFTNASTLISSLSEKADTVGKQLEELRSLRDSGALNVISPQTGNSSVLFYPVISYMKDRNILRVKEVGSCPYLVSFMLGFRLYLETVKLVRPKIVFLVPIGNAIKTAYKNYNWVTSDTQNNKSQYYSPVVFTNHPTKDVLTVLLDDTDYDTLLVVDMTKNAKNHTLNCKGEVRYASGGSRLLQEYNISKAASFSSITEVAGTLFTVPTFSEYPMDQSMRERLYLSECHRSYDVLYSLVRRK